MYDAHVDFYLLIASRVEQKDHYDLFHMMCADIREGGDDGREKEERQSRDQS